MIQEASKCEEEYRGLLISSEIVPDPFMQWQSWLLLTLKPHLLIDLGSFLNLLYSSRLHKGYNISSNSSKVESPVR